MISLRLPDTVVPPAASVIQPHAAVNERRFGFFRSGVARATRRSARRSSPRFSCGTPWHLVIRRLRLSIRYLASFHQSAYGSTRCQQLKAKLAGRLRRHIGARRVRRAGRGAEPVSRHRRNQRHEATAVSRSFFVLDAECPARSAGRPSRLPISRTFVLACPPTIGLPVFMLFPPNVDYKKEHLS
jgi:hypothetical protein